MRARNTEGSEKTERRRGLQLAGNSGANGAIGDTLLVQNPTSKKTLQAVVTGPGLASIGPAADQARALGRSQIALR